MKHRVTTFIKNANKKLLKDIERKEKELSKSLMKELMGGNKTAKFKGIIPQLTKNN